MAAWGGAWLDKSCIINAGPDHKDIPAQCETGLSPARATEIPGLSVRDESEVPGPFFEEQEFGSALKPELHIVVNAFPYSD